VVKNLDPAHMEAVALRMGTDRPREWLYSTGLIEEAAPEATELCKVLAWCLQSSPAIKVLSIRLGGLRDIRLWGLQSKLPRNLTDALGAVISSNPVGSNWGEDVWLENAERIRFHPADIAKTLLASPHSIKLIASIAANGRLIDRLRLRGIDFYSFDEDQIALGVKRQLMKFPDASPYHDLPDSEWARISELVLRGYVAWTLAMLSVSLILHNALDDLEAPEEAVQSIEIVSVTNLDPQATTGVAQTAERFLGLFSELLQSGKLGELDQAAGEHSLRQFLGEMQNPEGATGHVVRGYEMKMVQIYHRHIGIQGLRLVADDATFEKVESAITQAIEMGNAVEPEEAAKLAESIPTALLPSLSSREKFTSALGWSSGAALSATVAGAGGAKLVDGLGELGKILPAPWGAMIGAILGLLAYTFKPKGKS
jgi:hypothetical protein